tara:strand:- start:417 stop:626 length:210 start_codon:yes stop_codon:yes gene_type:complete
MSKTDEYNIGDLVKIKNNYDKARQIGIITEVKRKVHIKSYGSANVVVVYWFSISDFDWEYTFFLEKFDK